jgi:hypothetical protein
MIKARLHTSLTGAGVLLFGSLGCTSLNDLSSYSEGGSGLVGPAEPASGGSAGSGAMAAPQVQAGSGGAPTAAVEEQDPADVPLDPMPSDPAPAQPSDPPVAVDPIDRCDAAGEFTTPASSSCYLLGDATGSWLDARDLCQAWGGDLVEIGSADENAELADRSDADAWIGANDRDVEGTFVWAGAGLVEFAAWAFSQPDDDDGREDCSELRASDDAWNDVPCTGNTEKQTFCERTLPSPGE